MPQPDPTIHARPFSDFLREHGAGRTHDEAVEQVATETGLTVYDR